MTYPPLSSDDPTRTSLQWLAGVALVDAAKTLPTMACASKSTLRAVGIGAAAGTIDGVPSGRPGLRLIFNDDHGMMPSVTIVNRTNATIVLHALKPAVLATENGTYDLDALLAGAPRTIEPGAPLVIRITDIGRNAGEPFRVGTARERSEPAVARPEEAPTSGDTSDGGDESRSPSSRVAE